jgi:uncharacterized membrane protein (DUF4010 family)
LIGLLGGVWMLIADFAGEVVLGLAFGAFALVFLGSHMAAVQQRHDVGATTAVAALLTFALGAMAVAGELALAAAGAVITSMLLGLKPVMHRWLERISYEELLAVLKLLVMSVVLLPVLPNRGYGPWQALNPFELWWMIVLIAGLSFLGYAAARLLGPRRGILVTALCGGLTSSTAVAISFARFAVREPKQRSLFASGILLASTVMFPRVLIVIGIIDPALSAQLAWPLIGATFGGLGVVALLVREEFLSTAGDTSAAHVIRNPFELGMALKFGVLLAIIFVAARALNVWVGDSGIYALSAVSGLVDVDAVSLSLARMSADDIARDTVATAILIAVFVNTLVKAGIAGSMGGRSMGLYMAGGVAAMLLGAAVAFALSQTLGTVVVASII